MADSLKTLVLKIAGKKDPSLDGVLKTIENQTSSMVNKVNSISGKMAVGFGVATAGLLGIGKSFINAAARGEQYRTILFAVTKSHEETAKIIEKAREYARMTPFTVGDIIKATVQIKALGVDVDKTRHLAVTLAATFSSDLEPAVLALSRAQNGSAIGFRILRNQYGITAQELERFGGVVKNGTQVVTDNQDAVQKNSKALEKLIMTKWGNSIELQAGTAKTAFVNFGDALSRLQSAIGTELLPEVTKLVFKINDVLYGLGKMSDMQKTVIATTLKSAFVITASGFVLSTLVKIITSATIALTAFRSAWFLSFSAQGISMLSKTSGAFFALSTPILVLTAAIIALGVVWNKTILQQEQTAKIEADMIQQDSKALMAYFKFKRDGIVDINDKQQIALAIVGAQIQKDKEAIDIIKQKQKAQYEAGTSIWEDVNVAKLSAYRQQEVDNMNARIIKGEKLRELDKASISDKQKLLVAYNQLIATKTAEGMKEEDLQKLRIKAHDIEKDIQKTQEETAQKHKEMLEKQTNDTLKWLDNKKGLNQVSLRDEILFYQRMLSEHQMTTENRKDIEYKLLQVKRQLKQEEIKIEKEKNDKIIAENKKSLEKAKENIIQKGDVLGKFQEEYNKLTKSDLELEIMSFNTRLAEYKKVVTDEVKIKKFIEAEKLKITKEYIQKQKDAGKDVNDSEITRLQSLIAGYEQERGQNPGMGADEMSARNRLAMLLPSSTNSEANPVVNSDVMAQVNRIGESPTNINNTNANTSNDTIYNINIAGINLDGDKAKGLGSMLANLVPLDAVNRAESTIISMA